MKTLIDIIDTKNEPNILDSPSINLNDEVIIYPSEAGFRKINEIVAEMYGIKSDLAKNYVKNRTTDDNGFKEQLWEIMGNFGLLFFNGTTYLNNTTVKLSKVYHA